MVTVKKRKPATIQNANESVRNAPKLSKSRSAVLNPTRRFLSHGGSPDTFVIAKASTQRKIRPLLHKLASSLRHSVSFLRFTYGAWLSTGRGVARASRIRGNKNREISSKESGRFSAKICTSENFPLYGSLDLSLVLFLSSKFSSTQWNVVLISVQDYATTLVFHRACSVLVATTLDLQTTTQLSTMQNVERHNGRCFHFVCFLQYFLLRFTIFVLGLIAC